MQHAPKCWPGGSGGETGWGVDSAGDNSDINQLSNRPLRGTTAAARMPGWKEKETMVVTGALVSRQNPEEEADREATRGRSSGA